MDHFWCQSIESYYFARSQSESRHSFCEVQEKNCNEINFIIQTQPFLLEEREQSAATPNNHVRNQAKSTEFWATILANLQHHIIIHQSKSPEAVKRFPDCLMMNKLIKNSFEISFRNISHSSNVNIFKNPKQLIALLLAMLQLYS